MTGETRDVVADDGVRLRVRLHGEGRPLLLIPGLGGKASFWDEARPWLGPGRRLILPDHRGAGESDRPPGPYSISRLVSDCLRILDAVAPGPVDIVGHSTGGAIAQGIALAAPSRVARLVLSGTWARPDAHFQLTFATRLAVLRQAGAYTYSALTAAMGFPPDWFDAPAHAAPALFDQLAADLQPIAVAEARLQMLLDHPGLSDAALAGIGAETLVIGAVDDAIVPIRHQRQLSAAIPAATLVECDGGHFYPRSRARRFAETVRWFIEERCSF
jgi:aminoacrylate hydrolase